MKKAKANTTPIFSNCGDIKESLKLDFIGDFLINDPLTIKQLNESYSIKNALEIINEMLTEGIIEEVPDSKPKEYRLPSMKKGQWL